MNIFEDAMSEMTYEQVENLVVQEAVAVSYTHLTLPTTELV